MDTVESPSRLSEEDDARFLHALGERLRLIRARRGTSRRILSRQSDVSERYIAQLEAGDGNVSILKLRAIARALGVGLADLLGERTERAPDAALIEGLLSRLSEAELHEARQLLQGRFAAAVDHRHGRVALIGLRGAGKSTLGRMLAAARGVAFVELDREIERAAGMEISAVFELHGQAGFRRLERAVLERLAAEPAASVLAAGGSIVADPATFALLLGNWRTVWVRAAPEEHMQRVVDQGDLRPMQDNRQAMDDLRAILASREALYAKADLTLDTAGRTPEESFAELVRILG
ncbi:MAG: helix-turn-helix transcriptional regulator [Proteobacteria bacterium]|nr:helix-turn-helix transcriptional regulator [Pseudomonadota bacterium]